MGKKPISKATYAVVGFAILCLFMVCIGAAGAASKYLEDDLENAKKQVVVNPDTSDAIQASLPKTVVAAEPVVVASSIVADPPASGPAGGDKVDEVKEVTEDGSNGSEDDSNGSEDNMGKCNGYSENTNSSFKRNLKEWRKLAYISKMNEKSFIPSLKKPNQRTTNEKYFFGSIPKKFKTSYINDNGKWKHTCKCGNKSDCESADDSEACMVLNPFTKCKCAVGQYYDVSEKKCKQMEKGCENKAFNSDGKGSFYNFYHPLCNFKHMSGYASSDEKTEGNCCLSCDHKLKLIKQGEREKPHSDYVPDYAQNSGIDNEGEDLLKKDKDSTGFNSRPKFFYPLFNTDGGDDGDEYGTSKGVSQGALLLTDPGNAHFGDPTDPLLSQAPGLEVCEGSTACGSPGDDNFTAGYTNIKRNLFNCIRTSRKNMYVSGGHNWGKHPDWGANGSVQENAAFKEASSFGWEKDGRGWAPKDEIDIIYEKAGDYTEVWRNSNKQMCSHSERVKEESDEFDDEEDQVAAISQECDSSRFKFRGKEYTCGGHYWSCKGDNYKHGCATCSSVAGQGTPSTSGFSGVPVKFLKR
jgi:hypothetical protein